VAESLLAIWLYGRRVAIVERERKGRLRLGYTEQALAAYEGGTPLLSLALPLIRARYPNGSTRAFLDGLLPEGEPRRAIAADLDLPASDVFGLIGALGRDCAGALVVQPADEPPPVMPSTTSAEPLSDDDLGELMAGPRFSVHRVWELVDRSGWRVSGGSVVSCGGSGARHDRRVLGWGVMLPRAR
jgi:serine/threonine-protein kinase HipA